MAGTKKKKLVLIVFLAAGLILAYFLLPLDSFTFENIKGQREIFKEFVEEHYGLSVALFIGAHILTGFFLPGEILLVLVGGFLFGVFWGTLFVDLGMTLGAGLSFLSARYLIGNWIQHKYARPLKNINREIAQRGKSYLLTLRIIPVVPFFLVNYIAGISKIRFRTFLWTTFLGILPGAVFVTYAGQQLGGINRVKDLFSLEFYLMLGGLALFAALPVVSKRIKVLMEKLQVENPP